MGLRHLAFASLTIATALGCSSKQEKLPPESNIGSGNPQPGSGNVATDGGADATGDVACTPITNSGSQVAETYVGEALPLPLGGTITPGTYVLTAAFVYTGNGGNAGPTGRLVQETRTFDGAVFADILATGDADGGTFATEFFATGSYVAAGSQLRLDETCPTAGSTNLTYSVTGTTLRIYDAQTERDFTAQ